MNITKVKKSSFLYVLLIPATILFVVLGSRFLFIQGQNALHTQLQRTMQLDFESGFKEQLALARQMARSPIIIKYIEDPKDKSVKDLAFEEFQSFADSFKSKSVFWVSTADRRFYNGMQFQYEVDPTLPSEYWYNMTIYETEEYNFNINYNAQLQEIALWLNVVIRGTDRTTPVGMAGTGILLSDFINNMYKDLPAGYEMYIFNDSLETTGSKNLQHLSDKTPISELIPFIKGFEQDIINQKKKNINNFGVYCSFGRIDAVNWNVVIFKKFDAVTFALNARLPLLIVIIVVIINIILRLYRKKTLKDNSSVGQSLLVEMEKLVNSSKENAQTSQDQSAAVKEIVTTMEDSHSMSETISKRIQNVSSVAAKTSADVIAGVDTLAQNFQKLHDISDANLKTIEGIKSLSDKIENIWDIVSIINSVADQAKIIAFNAELEASSAGEAGQNFHIVATEIRRLADGIIDGTKEIKEKISEIQQSSDHLILMSESGTEKVNEGCEKAKELEEKFSSIKMSAEVTADSSNEISSIISQQTVASEQILLALKQIAFGVENFSQATDRISESAENVRMIAEKLNGTTSASE